MGTLHIGMELYHKTRKTRCVIKAINGKEITIELEHKIGDKKELKLPLKCIGEWLFYKKEHVDLDLDALSEINEYSTIEKIIKYKESKQKKFEKETAIEKQRLEDCKVIKSILRDRNIKSLVHFTRVENLESILVNGFIPRRELYKSNIKYILNDKERYDGKNECTCFSVEFPNSYLLRNFRFENPYSDWVVIEIDADVLIKHKGKKYFCYYNAACSDVGLVSESVDLTRPEYFKKMFSFGHSYSTVSGGKVIYREIGLKGYLPTQEQAEILIAETIPPDYIKTIYFKDENAYEWFMDNCYYNEIISKFRFQIDEKYFSPRDTVKFDSRGVRNKEAEINFEDIWSGFLD